MKMGKMLLVVALIAIVPMAQAEVIIAPNVMPNAASQTPSDASLQKLMEIMQFDKNLEQRLEQDKGIAEQAIQQTLKNTLKNTGLTASQLQQIQQISKEFLQKMIKEQNRPEVRQKMITVYQQTLKETYTQEEIDTMIGFYSMPTGQSILAKQNIVAKTYSDKIMPFLLESTQTITQKLLPDYQQKLEKIIQKSTPKVKK